jgi:hypothetical protein
VTFSVTGKEKCELLIQVTSIKAHTGGSSMVEVDVYLFTATLLTKFGFFLS